MVIGGKAWAHHGDSEKSVCHYGDGQKTMGLLW